jgi:hypothetical protein
MHQGFAQALQVQLIDLPELVDQAFEQAEFHEGRRMSGRTLGPQRYRAHAAPEIALADGFDLHEAGKFGFWWHGLFAVKHGRALNAST